MFSIFSKKQFLIDSLEGFVDIHNHILPGIDDGAKTVRDSLDLLKEFGTFGVNEFICTPHIMDNYYPNTPNTIGMAFNQVLVGLKGEKHINDVRIHMAAEHMIDSNFENLLSKNEVMPLAQNYILIEMSYLQESLNFKEAINKIKEKGLFPIFAHPERYIYLTHQKGSYTTVKNLGILFQLNLLSLSNHYGEDIRKKAFKLLEDNQIDFVASDVHNMKHLLKLKEIQISQKVLKLLKPIIDKTIYNFT